MVILLRLNLTEAELIAHELLEASLSPFISV